MSQQQAACYDYDFIVIGSGFGGSVSALRLAEKGYQVAVVEMGKRWRPEDFPSTNWKLHKYLWRPSAKLEGFFNIRLFKHVMVVCGNAVGGGSITYANTLLVPPDSVWRDGSWAGLTDWQTVMPKYYATAKNMLGVTTNRTLGDADHLLKQMADHAGIGNTFYHTDVAVLFGPEGTPPGTQIPDPFFNGEGPTRRTCTGCGGCMTGCRVGAKNTLDQNYLYLAERRGAEVVEQTRVTRITPLSEDGQSGYQLILEPATQRTKATTSKRTVHCRGLIIAASSLGTQELLLKQRADGYLPKLSQRLGKFVRTNAESIIGVRFRDRQYDLSKGIAIGSGIYLDQYTHIEAVRYAAGHDALGVQCSPLVRPHPRLPNALVWLATLLRYPRRALRIHNPIGFARQTLVLLCMQTLDSHLTMRLKRPWYWPFQRLLCSDGARIPTGIEQANTFAEKSAKLFNADAISALPEVLFGIPTTAHCMGGAVMGRNAAEGVIDYRCRVWGYKNLYICDGSILSANLGVNPSLTILALTEHAMSHIPSSSQHDWQDEAGKETLPQPANRQGFATALPA
ncbi:GMC family oxidoreductase [Chitinivorax sp. B]|uniref:GMC oxidoreductase n=1 Tax=Chitinivorax sp. B TaxID=2502235 RepID=UPI0010F4E7F2|nr:GMC family oxidoreductase [Chitinivorax sp. B]